MTTASSTSISAPASPPTRPCCRTRCSATTPASASRMSPPRAASATCKKATPSPSETLTAQATKTSSKRWEARLPGDSYQSVLYRNPGHGNHSITLILEGVKTNRAAFGARICVTVTTRTGQSERSIAPSATDRASAATPLRQHIGIADATQVQRIEIDWPTSRSRQTFTQVKRRPRLPHPRGATPPPPPHSSLPQLNFRSPLPTLVLRRLRHRRHVRMPLQVLPQRPPQHTPFLSHARSAPVAAQPGTPGRRTAPPPAAPRPPSAR